jgi:tRNA (guanine37-N1)-methyltransferase
MRIDFITGFPALFTGPLTESMLKRAREAGFVEFHVHDLRDYAHDRHHTIDDSPYGGGAGMVLKPEPIMECADKLMSERSYDAVVMTSAMGERFAQPLANKLSLCSNIMIICGHYKGVDDRVRQLLNAKEISIGDYVLTGGELAAMVIADALVRLVPGVVGDGESLLTDSFQNGMLDCPYFTRPPSYRGLDVPEALLSGDHERIARWRADVADGLTRERRPDLSGVS